MSGFVDEIYGVRVLDPVATKTCLKTGYATKVMTLYVIGDTAEVKECAAVFFGLFYGCPYNAVGRGYFAKVIA